MRNAVLFAVALSALFAGPAGALIIEPRLHSVTAEFLDTAGNVVTGQTDFELSPDTHFTRPLSAFIGGGGYRASVGSLPSGLFGVEGQSQNRGTLATRVSYIETLINPFSHGIDLTASFIITGGSMSLVGNAGSSIIYSISAFGTDTWNTGGTLRGTDAFGSTFSASGEDIGARFDSGSVEIPFSVRRVSLGRLDPGESLTFSYNFAMLIIGDVLEVGRFEFRDPPAVDGVVSYEFATAVPGPPTAWLLLPAGLLLALTRRASGG